MDRRHDVSAPPPRKTWYLAEGQRARASSSGCAWKPDRCTVTVKDLPAGPGQADRSQSYTVPAQQRLHRSR